MDNERQKAISESFDAKRRGDKGAKRSLKGVALLSIPLLVVPLLVVTICFGTLAALAPKARETSFLYAYTESVKEKTRYDVKDYERPMFEKAGIDVYQDENGSYYAYANPSVNKITGWKGIDESIEGLGEALDIGAEKARLTYPEMDSIGFISSYAADAMSLDGGQKKTNPFSGIRNEFAFKEDNLAPVSLKRYFSSFSLPYGSETDSRNGTSMPYSLASTLADLAFLRQEGDQRERGLRLYGYGFQALVHEFLDDPLFVDSDIEACYDYIRGFDLAKWTDLTRSKSYGQQWSAPGVLSPSRFRSCVDAYHLLSNVEAGMSLKESLAETYLGTEGIKTQDFYAESGFDRVTNDCLLFCGAVDDSDAFLQKEGHAIGFPLPYEETKPLLEKNRQRIFLLVLYFTELLMRDINPSTYSFSS